MKYSIYEELGIKTLINAAGPKSICGGTRINQKVLKAMAAASQSFVNIIDLNRKIGEYIAHITGAEAGMVTNGTANALALSAAACMTGTNLGKIRQLPNTHGLKDEFIIQKIHYGEYAYCSLFAGGILKEVGNVNSCLPEEVEDTLTERTAAIIYLITPRIPKGGLSLQEIIKIAHFRNVPVIVDAAAMLPPKSNLEQFIREGADLVAFSGGKFLHGPQSTGILFGKKDLIEAALANAGPNHGIGRISKFTKEALVGLYVALKLYVETDEQKLIKNYLKKIQYIYNYLKDIKHIKLNIEHDYIDYLLPTLTLQFLSPLNPINYKEFEKLMLQGDPPILIQYLQGYNHLIINPIGLNKDETKIVAKRLREELMREIKP